VRSNPAGEYGSSFCKKILRRKESSVSVVSGDDVEESATSSTPTTMMPDLAVFFKAFNLTIHDDMTKNSPGVVLQVSLSPG
jgi:hypothetical protein